MARKRAAASVSFFAFQDIITSVVGIFVLITIIMMIELASRSVYGASSQQRVSHAQSAVLSKMQAEVADLQRRLEELSRIAVATAASQPMTVEEKRKEIKKQLDQTLQRIKRFEALQRQTSRALETAETSLRQLKDGALSPMNKEEQNQKLLGRLAYLRAELDSLHKDDPLIFANRTLQGKNIVLLDIDAGEIRVLELAANRRQVFSGADRLAQVTKWIESQNLLQIHFLMILRPDSNPAFAALRTFFESKHASYGFDVIGAKRPLKMRGEVAAQEATP